VLDIGYDEIEPNDWLPPNAAPALDVEVAHRQPIAHVIGRWGA
jgi:hypothetical protein